MTSTVEDIEKRIRAALTRLGSSSELIDVYLHHALVWFEGACAYVRDMQITDNPFTDGSVDHSFWMTAFDAANCSHVVSELLEGNPITLPNGDRARLVKEPRDTSAHN